MKNIKFLWVAALLLLTVLLLVSCSGDVQTTETDPIETPAETQPETTEPIPYDPNHEHVYAEDEAALVAPTCTKTGKKMYYCTVPGCEKTKTERLERVDHAAAAPATCMAEAVCSMCTKVLEKKTEHTYGEPTVIAATCTEDGSSTLTCTVCGEQKVTKLSKDKAHTFTESKEGAVITKVCTLCGYTTSGVEHTTILKYDFETDLEMKEYLSSFDGFTYKQGEISQTALCLEEGTENHYGRFHRGTFISDENLAMLKNDKYFIEFDIKLDDFTRRANMSLFTMLPGWVSDAEGGSKEVSWLYYMKMNSESKDDLKIVTPGEFVTYKDCSGEVLNTGKILEAGKWYHVTMEMDWVSGTTNIYVGERGSDENTYITTVNLELTDSFNKELDPPDGKPCTTRDKVTTNAMRFSDNMATTDLDNFHIYTAEKPLWDVAK